MLKELTFTEKNFSTLCYELGERDPRLKKIISDHGLPPMWVRTNSFETLVLTILEQQVSLASAYAAFKKLKERVGEITPKILLQLSDDDLRACYFSRQKMVYVRGLATAIDSGSINLEELYHQEESFVREKLIELKGIGNWTVDIYLIHALRRTDIFPVGDLALLNSVKMLWDLPGTTSKQEIQLMAEAWKPYRTIATMMLWHYYILKKNIKLLH